MSWPFEIGISVSSARLLLWLCFFFYIYGHFVWQDWHLNEHLSLWLAVACHHFPTSWLGSCNNNGIIGDVRKLVAGRSAHSLSIAHKQDFLRYVPRSGSSREWCTQNMTENLRRTFERIHSKIGVKNSATIFVPHDKNIAYNEGRSLPLQTTMLCTV